MSFCKGDSLCTLIGWDVEKEGRLAAEAAAEAGAGARAGEGAGGEGVAGKGKSRKKGSLGKVSSPREDSNDERNRFRERRKGQREQGGG